MSNLTVDPKVPMMNRVKFDTQSEAHGEDIPLVNAAKTVFDSSKPSVWTICASISPPLLWPFIRLLSCIFPGKTMMKSQKAFQTLYDASDALIQVRSPAGRPFHCICYSTRHRSQHLLQTSKKYCSMRLHTVHCRVLWGGCCSWT